MVVEWVRCVVNGSQLQLRNVPVMSKLEYVRLRYLALLL